MPIGTDTVLGALAALALTCTTAGIAAAQAHSQNPARLTFVSHLTDIEFFSNTGPIRGWPTRPLVPGDRIIGQDHIKEYGVAVGRDNETCTISFNRDVLCQDIVVLNGQGDLQASWTVRWPATGNRGPSSFDGVVDGGTGRFANAHGTLHASTLPNGETEVSAVLK